MKRRLATHFREQRQTYTEVKDPVCDIIVAAAHDWAAATSWRPGATDA